ncbi:MAG TPA: hypothetical protein VEC56_04520 [Candidatus Krumholzibacteria bacterium]|nr:hypothetical protein [Candidatus Krumholzibacteria bacterium]
MHRRLLSRVLIAVAAFASIGASASEVLAQTQQLNKELVRKFPEGFCPLDTNFIGTFVSNTGIIQLTFVTGLGPHGNGLKSGDVAVGFNQVLDDVAIIEAAEFAANSVENSNFCYSDGNPFVPEYPVGLLAGNPKVPFFDLFNPVTSPCPWDETNGATINLVDGWIEFTGAGDVASTSVVISGLTPGTQYVIAGQWSAIEFPFATECTPTSLCLQITVDDLPNGCGPLPVETKTWGQVKALYNK